MYICTMAGLERRYEAQHLLKMQSGANRLSRMLKINAEQIADISKDIADKLGEFSAAGTGVFQDYADVMKLTKEQLKQANELARIKAKYWFFSQIIASSKTGMSKVHFNNFIKGKKDLGAERLAKVERMNEDRTKALLSEDH